MTEYLAPNLVAEAARDLGVTDDRVWMALGRRRRCAKGKGSTNGRWRPRSARRPADLDQSQIARTRALAGSRSAGPRQHGGISCLQVTQRPTFVIDSEIGDRAVFSGFAKLPPLVATIDAMLDDLAAYASHAAHFGGPLAVP